MMPLANGTKVAPRAAAPGAARVGIGGPVGSGKTRLIEQLIPRLLGPTALEDPDEELPPLEEEEDDFGADSLDFMLDDEGELDTSLGSDLLPPGEGDLTGTGMSSLRLGEDLQLNLDGE